MSRFINLVLFVFVLMGAFWLYQVKHEAKQEEERISALQNQIEAEKDALLLLKAEWSYLNRPQRVQRLSEELSEELGLAEIEPHQIGDVADLPDRPEGPSLTGNEVNSVNALLHQVQPTTAKTE